MEAFPVLTPTNRVSPSFTVREGDRSIDDTRTHFVALDSLIAEIRETSRQRNQLLRTENGLASQQLAVYCRLNPDDPKCKRRDREMGEGLRVLDDQTGVALPHLTSGDLSDVDDQDVDVAAEAVEGGRSRIGTHHKDASLADFVSLPMIDAQDVIRPHRKRLERRLGAMGKQLPVWTWAEGVRGFGAVGLAQIIGETGDLSNYANPAKVWKRMGLAVMDDGTPQRRVASVEGALLHGFVPRRRATMFVIGDSLIKGNRDGEYYTLYKSRKEYEREQHPELAPFRHHQRAQRYMEKRLLRDLWRAWRDDGNQA